MAFTVSLANPSVVPVSVDYASLAHEATLADADYQSTSGTLSSAPGDNSTREVRVFVHGDTRFEPDEILLIGLTNANHAVIGKYFGVGTILNDAPLNYVAPNDGEPNELVLRLSGYTLELVRNDEAVVRGTFSSAVPISVIGADGIENSLTVDLGSDIVLLQRGLHFQGGDSSENRLTILDGLATDVVHTMTGVTEGGFRVGRGRITNAGVQAAVDGLSGMLTGISATNCEGNEINLGISAAGGSAISWRVTKNGHSVAVGTGSNLAFTPPGNGEYLVGFTVAAEGGRVGVVQRVIYVDNAAPNPVNAGSDQALNEGDMVTLASTFTDPGTADTHTFTWHVVATNGPTIADGTGQDFTFVASDAGIYAVTFSVMDDDGGTASDTLVVTVSTLRPSSRWSAILRRTVATLSKVKTSACRRPSRMPVWVIRTQPSLNGVTAAPQRAPSRNPTAAVVWMGATSSLRSASTRSVSPSRTKTVALTVP